MFFTPTNNSIFISIPGTPFAKRRPQFTTRHRRSYAYNPQNYEKNLIIKYIKDNYPTLSPIDKDTPLILNINFYLSITLNDAKLKQWGIIPPIHKPDTSNLLKFYEDCLNSLAYHDDSQIVSIVSQKFYDDNPRTEIEVIKMNTLNLDPATKKIFNTYSPAELDQLAKDAQILSDLLSVSNDSPLRLITISNAIKDFSALHGQKLNKIKNLVAKNSILPED